MQGRRRLWTTRGVGAGVVLAAAAVALAPLEPVQIEPADQRPTGELVAAQAGPAPLDAAAFDVRLWNPGQATAEPIEASAPVAAPPLDLVLVGITRVDGRLVAAILDRREGTVRLVGDGDQLDDFDVEVDERTVALARGDARHVLELAEVDR
ncbi:MAG TPA: hypothetical protein VJP77_09065 [Planctomycetota bacterium]|nr:hypothetical protein [Planctomycetota bacterium]